MFFIAGAGKQANEIGQGEFNCPQCNEWRSYVQKRISSYVSAFFVPVWRSSGGSEFVECKSCGSQFDNEVLAGDFDRNHEIARLTEVTAESGQIAVESRDPEVAQAHYDLAIEAFRLALALRPDPDLRRDIRNAREVLKNYFPSSLCINEALGICDEANNHSSPTEQLELLLKAKKLLEDGLARHDIGYDDIMSIYEQVVPYVQQAEALTKTQSQ